MEIAVLGGGNGSLAAACDLTEQGHSVRLWRRNATAQKALRDAGNILNLKDFEGTRKVTIALVSDSLPQAVSGAELILCPTPATAQYDIAKGLSTCLVSGQVVFMPPGSFGSWIMAKAMKESRVRELFIELCKVGCRKAPVFAVCFPVLFRDLLVILANSRGDLTIL